MDLTALRHIEIPNGVLNPTLEFLAERGQHNHEGFVVWGAKVTTHGPKTPDPTPVLRFTSCYVPEQTAHQTAQGLLVTVDGDALFRMNRAFYQRGEIAAGQVHTHPTDAYHSDTDDHFPLVTLRGALSVVVPDFAKDGREALNRWAWYRLQDHAHWEALTNDTHVYLEPETETPA